MLTNQNKQNQFYNLRLLVEDEEEELISKGLSRDNNREVNRDSSNDQAIISAKYLVIPGFLEDQTNSLIYYFNGIFSSVFKRYFLILANQGNAMPTLQSIFSISPDDFKEELDSDIASISTRG